jgi:hypothetical protein
VVCDELVSFKLVKANINPSQKNALLEFLRGVETKYRETLEACVSWRIDYIDKINYNVKGDAQRTFACEVSLITMGEEIDSLNEML